MVHTGCEKESETESRSHDVRMSTNHPLIIVRREEGEERKERDKPAMWRNLTHEVRTTHHILLMSPLV